MRIGSVSLSPAAMLGSGCQGLELREKRWSHGGAGVLWWCREKRREKESFDFAREKWCLGGGLEFFRGIFVFSGV